jgi:hypothetical protein
MKTTVWIKGLAAITLIGNGWAQPALTITLNNPAGGPSTLRLTANITVRTELTQAVTGELIGMFSEERSQRFPAGGGQGLAVYSDGAGAKAPAQLEHNRLQWLFPECIP